MTGRDFAAEFAAKSPEVQRLIRREERFVCINCGWSGWGCWGWPVAVECTVPDTDCEQCGFHDSVRDTGEFREPSSG